MEAKRKLPTEFPEEFEARCAGKERYPSMSAADAAIRIYREMDFLRKPSLLSSYFCNYCLSYHFGHEGGR